MLSHRLARRHTVSEFMSHLLNSPLRVELPFQCMVCMLKQSADKTASSAIRFGLCVLLGQKNSNLVVGRRIAWKDVVHWSLQTNDDTRRKNTSRSCISEIN